MTTIRADLYFDTLVVVRGDAAALDAVLASLPTWCAEWTREGDTQLVLWTGADGVSEDEIERWRAEIEARIGERA